MIDFLEEIAKIKYHQRLLLSIALGDEREQYTYFQFVIDHDLSEKEAKTIVQLLVLFSTKYKNKSLLHFHPDILNLVDKDFSVNYASFEKALKQAHIHVNPEYLLLSLKQQFPNHRELCKYILGSMETGEADSQI